MKRVTFKFKTGLERKMLIAAADILVKRGLGTYGDSPEKKEEPVSDGLDEMEKAELHALAKERGLHLHHMLGADKVRTALRGQE